MKEMKTGLLAGALLLAMAVSTSAGSVKSVVGLNGANDANGRSAAVTSRFYLPVGGHTVVAGLNAWAPVDQDGKESSYEALLGLAFDCPVLGSNCEITTGISKEGTSGADIKIAPVRITKNAMYSLTKDVQVGLTLDILEIGVDEDGVGGKYVSVLPNIYPVLGATINF